MLTSFYILIRIGDLAKSPYKTDFRPKTHDEIQFCGHSEEEMIQNTDKPRTSGTYFPNIPRISVYIYECSGCKFSNIDCFFKG